ncbi:hypothetical protein [Synechocystis sp. PCC 7509]|nr:hypothetical protein [Synechocystis sp. PCC 7509]
MISNILEVRSPIQLKDPMRSPDYLKYITSVIAFLAKLQTCDRLPN